MKSSFDFKKYLIRVAKYLVYMAVVFFLIITIFALTSGQKEFNYESLFRAGTGIQLLVFFIVMSFAYPLVSFIKKRAYLNHPFAEEREKVLKVFENSNYIIVAQEATTITFRHKSPVTRLFRMYEDTIIVDFSDNPIILEGMRKDVFRLARSIEYATREVSE
ncbi:MAG: hypothetical protein M0R37_00990 [Bacteroidales bacterium]|nr:hypothetical protein [Bacteroidales bacterium]